MAALKTPVAPVGRGIEAEGGMDKAEGAERKRRPTPQPLPVREGSNMHFFLNSLNSLNSLNFLRSARSDAFVAKRRKNFWRVITPLPPREGLGGGSVVGLQIQCGCGRLVAGGLEDVVVVANDEGNGGELVERVAGEVDLACLAVGKSDAVVDNGGVAGSDAAHGNRLHPPCPTVVAEGDARHVAEGVGDGVEAKAEHAVAVDALNGNGGPQGADLPLGHDIDALQFLYRLQRTIVLGHGGEGHERHEHAEKAAQAPCAPLFSIHFPPICQYCFSPSLRSRV